MIHVLQISFMLLRNFMKQKAQLQRLISRAPFSLNTLVLLVIFFMLYSPSATRIVCILLQKIQLHETGSVSNFWASFIYCNTHSGGKNIKL